MRYDICALVILFVSIAFMVLYGIAKEELKELQKRFNHQVKTNVELLAEIQQLDKEIENNYINEMRIRSLVAFISNRAANVYGCESIEDARKVAARMSEFACKAITDASIVDDCENVKEDDDFDIYSI